MSKKPDYEDLIARRGPPPTTLARAAQLEDAARNLEMLERLAREQAEAVGGPTRPERGGTAPPDDPPRKDATPDKTAPAPISTTGARGPSQVPVPPPNGHFSDGSEVGMGLAADLCDETNLMDHDRELAPHPGPNAASPPVEPHERGDLALGVAWSSPGRTRDS